MKIYICGMNEYRNILNRLNRQQICENRFHNIRVSFFRNKCGHNMAQIVVG